MDDPFDQIHGPAGANDVPKVNLIDNDTAGPDNRPVGAAPQTFSAPTGADGKARVTLTVSMQPGNNYRAAASCIDDVFGGSDPQVDQTDADAKQYDHSPGWSGYEVPAVWSKMLTVWRKLYVEFDSMAAEPTTVVGREPDWQNVHIENVTVNAQTSTLHLSSAPTGNNPHQFEGGRIIPSGGFTLGVIDHTGNTIEIDRALIPPEISYVLDRDAVLKDDDPNSGLLPKFYTITPLIKTAYQNAYIDIVELPAEYNPNRQVSFDLYVVWLTEFVPGWGWNNSKDHDSSNAYWTSFLVAGYQAGGDVIEVNGQDNDPDPLVDNSTYPDGPFWPDEYSETLATGWTGESGDRDTLIFRATIVDFPMWPQYESQVIAHEVGHSGGSSGTQEEHQDEGGLMSGSWSEDDDGLTAPRLKRFDPRAPPLGGCRPG